MKEEFEDIKGVIRIHISKKNRQHNDRKKKHKRKNNRRSTKHTYTTKDRVIRTPLKRIEITRHYDIYYRYLQTGQFI